MKKIYLSALALVFGVGINAQLQNGGFESWTASEADQWESLDAFATQLTGAGGVVQIGGNNVTESVTESTTDPIEGSSNAQIQSFTLSNTPNAGIAPDGVYGNFVSQVVQTADKHEGVAFAYKADIQGTDAVGVFVNATKNGAVVAQGYKVYTASSAAWVRDTVKLNFSAAPDEIEILFASSFGTIISGTSAPATGVDGTIMEVDDVQLLAEPAFADPATNIAASDISDNGDGSDLQVTFDAAADESTVTEYRVIVIEQGLALADWSAVPAPLYTVVTPDGSANYSVTLTSTDQYLASAGGTSVAPQAIAEDQPMDVYVYSIADGTNATANQIAGPSNTITLTSATSSLFDLTKTVSVYPNPANDFVNFKVDGLENGTITINSITGQEVVNASISGTEKVNVNHLNNGVYIYTVRNANGEVVKTNKLIIRK